MPTLGELKSEIASDLVRKDLGAEIDRACIAAHRFYRARRLRFNEARTVMNTAIGQGVYGVSSGLPADILEIDSISVDESGWRRLLCQAGSDEIEAMDSPNSTHSVPDVWSIRGEELRLWPVPNKAYPLTIFYLQDLPLPADGASNAWTNQAGDLIKAHAKRIIARDKLRDFEYAASQASAEAEALSILVSESGMQQSTGRIRGGW